MSKAPGLDPRVKLLLLLQAGVWAVLLERPFALGLAAGAAVACLCLSGAGARRLAIALGTLGLALWAMAVTQAVFYAQAPRTEWVAWRPESEFARSIFGPEGVALYREGFGHGLTQGLRLVLAAAAGLSVAFSTDPGELLAALSFFRAPHGLSFMTVTALRFAPALAQEALTAWTAARLRGFSPWRSAPWTTFGVGLGLARPVLASCIRRASTLAASVSSRGFDPAQGEAAGLGLRMGLSSWLVAGLTILATAGLLAAKALYSAYLHEIYYRADMRGVYEFTRKWL